MKKLVIFVLALALLLGGCAFLKSAEQVVCNPPADVMAVANAALPVLEMLIAMAVPGSEPYLEWATADNIQHGICVSVTQLNNLIELLDSNRARLAQLRMARGKGLTVAAPLDTEPLKKWAANRK